ncbi:MAG: hypothetical protein WB902_21815 [Acetobacteraceae bacterium]
MNLLAALADPNLFQPLFAGPSWAPWRAFLKSLFALPFTDDELSLYRRHTERTAPPRSRSTKRRWSSAAVAGSRASLR